MFKPVQPLDAALLAMDSPNSLMNTGTLIEFDPPADGRPFGFEEVRDHYLERVRMSPLRYRRLVQAPFKLARPAWVSVDSLDENYHFARFKVTDNWDSRIREIAARLVGQPLDHRHPLWRMAIIEGHPSGRVAVAICDHHATIDVESGVEMMKVQFDTEPTPARTYEVSALPEPTPRLSPIAKLKWIAVDHIQTLRATPRFWRAVIRYLSSRAMNLKDPLRAGTAPRLAWNDSVTLNRGLGLAELDLDDVKRVAKLGGQTVSDVLLYLVTTALRRYLAQNKQLPSDPLVAVCTIPGSRNKAADSVGGVNRWSAVPVTLRTDIADPLDRFVAAKESAEKCIERREAQAPVEPVHFAAGFSYRTLRLVSKLKASRTFIKTTPPCRNLVFTNGRGPDTPLYVAGGRMASICMIGPLFDGCGLLVSALSYAGKVFVAFNTCTDLIPDTDSLASGVAESLNELTASLQVPTAVKQAV